MSFCGRTNRHGHDSGSRWIRLSGSYVTAIRSTGFTFNRRFCNTIPARSSGRRPFRFQATYLPRARYTLLTRLDSNPQLWLSSSARCTHLRVGSTPASSSPPAQEYVATQIILFLSWRRWHGEGQYYPGCTMRQVRRFDPSDDRAVSSLSSKPEECGAGLSQLACAYSAA